MNIAVKESSTSQIALWSGRALSGLVVIFLAFDAGMKIISLPIVAETSVQLGWPAHLGVTLGILLLGCTLLYAFPRTAILGAVLLTAYLGGAVATHVRIENPLFTHVLFGVYVGAALWGGLYLRDEKLRSLIPWRR
ncbi:DoxX family protein [Microvirga alba]|uniref:DoxX family protein n=1 Tax=Microvirga alba TaxID=2791025 RepID=A0A931BMW5_9HYPH|nr:DoxX family protein [Microvirga alba]MBF9232419.1 DoxX family protein [Microvirga alba]